LKSNFDPLLGEDVHDQNLLLWTVMKPKGGGRRRVLGEDIAVKVEEDLVEEDSWEAEGEGKLNSSGKERDTKIMVEDGITVGDTNSNSIAESSGGSSVTSSGGRLRRLGKKEDEDEDEDDEEDETHKHAITTTRQVYDGEIVRMNRDDLEGVRWGESDSKKKLSLMEEKMN
jgi:hypothetical protein